jgi:(E)-4-hydroxy-3-methylbut-2-enyl-diphosphate synthase
MNRSVPIASLRRADWRWFRTSAKPSRDGIPAARAAAVSATDFWTQYPLSRAQDVARPVVIGVAGDVPGVVPDSVAHGGEEARDGFVLVARVARDLLDEALHDVAVAVDERRWGEIGVHAGHRTADHYPSSVASRRQIDVGGVKIGGGAPVAVQSMTKTETADYDATLKQVRAIADAGADLVRVAVPREKDVEALKRLVVESPIPVIADIHFNHTLALKAIDAGAHCVRLNPGNIGGPEKVAEVAKKATAAGVPMRIGVNSGSLPKHLHELEKENPVEALVTAAVEFVELMEGLDFENFKVSIKSTSVPNTIASNRLLSERIDYPIHLGITEAGTKWSGSLKSAVGLGTLLADGVGDTVRISLSTFHAEEEVKVAWEILKALKLRERGPVLIACPTCGRLQFDMDTVVAEIEERLEGYEEPIEVAVLGCAVNGIGEASAADFGITGAKNEGLIFAHGKPLRKVPQAQLVDALFAEIDKSLRQGKTEFDERESAEGAEWLQKIEDENADDLTPERIAALEAAAATEEAGGQPLPMAPKVKLDESVSPTAGRRFTRA